MKKGEVTRRLNLLAGTRPPLPGNHHLHEGKLRLDLAESFKPANAIEMLWVADIAYCTTVIEMYQVQITGYRRRLLKEAYAAECAPDPFASDVLADSARTSIFAPDERAELDALAAADFQGPRVGSVLERAAFAMLLGRMSRQEVEHLRLLQQLLHDEMKERDRLINQIDRRRRFAMRDAIEWAEARQRAEAADLVALPAPAAGTPSSDDVELFVDAVDAADVAEGDEDETDLAMGAGG